MWTYSVTFWIATPVKSVPQPQAAHTLSQVIEVHQQYFNGEVGDAFLNLDTNWSRNNMIPFVINQSILRQQLLSPLTGILNMGPTTTPASTAAPVPQVDIIQPARILSLGDFGCSQKIFKTPGGHIFACQYQTPPELEVAGGQPMKLTDINLRRNNYASPAFVVSPIGFEMRKSYQSDEGGRHGGSGRESTRSPKQTPLEEQDPIYVKVKQYDRIMKRRLARAKLETSGRILTKRPKYLQESRHKHAMNRPRGSSGRFIQGQWSANNGFHTMPEIYAKLYSCPYFNLRNQQLNEAHQPLETAYMKLQDIHLVISETY